MTSCQYNHWNVDLGKLCRIASPDLEQVRGSADKGVTSSRYIGGEHMANALIGNRGYDADRSRKRFLTTIHGLHPLKEAPQGPDSARYCTLSPAP